MKTAIIALAFAAVVAQPGYSAPAVDGRLSVMDARLFPVLAQMGSHSKLDSVHKILNERRHRYAACKTDTVCKITAAVWTDAERDALASAAAELRPQSMTPNEARAGVLREINGLNSVLHVYGQGMAPRYPAIDGPDAARDRERFNMDIEAAIALSEAGGTTTAGSIDGSVDLALSLLDAAGRTDAAAFEPLNETQNRGALERSRTLDWSHYRYTAILLLGVGPDDLSTPLSARGKLNTRLAAKRYFDGVAPYIIVSGGAVHPRGARFFEAVEMRRALIERYNVPADAIVLEPYARHTTTNLRNASRLLADLHAPFDKDALIVSNSNQISYIASEEFDARNKRELGYLPGTIGKGSQANELTFRPSWDSKRIDPADPLDP